VCAWEGERAELEHAFHTVHNKINCFIYSIVCHLFQCLCVFWFFCCGWLQFGEVYPYRTELKSRNYWNYFSCAFTGKYCQLLSTNHNQAFNPCGIKYTQPVKSLNTPYVIYSCNGEASFSTASMNESINLFNYLYFCPQCVCVYQPSWYWWIVLVLVLVNHYWWIGDIYRPALVVFFLFLFCFFKKDMLWLLDVLAQIIL